MTNPEDITLSGINQMPCSDVTYMCNFKMLNSQKQNRKVKGVLTVYGREQVVGKLPKLQTLSSIVSSENLTYNTVSVL